MTLRQFAALRVRKLMAERETELMFSRLTAAVLNSGFMHPKEPFADTHFMLHPFPEPPEPPERHEPPGDAILRMLERLPQAEMIRM